MTSSSTPLFLREQIYLARLIQEAQQKGLTSTNMERINGIYKQVMGVEYNPQDPAATLRTMEGLEKAIEVLDMDIAVLEDRVPKLLTSILTTAGLAKPMGLQSLPGTGSRNAANRQAMNDESSGSHNRAGNGETTPGMKNTLGPTPNYNCHSAMRLAPKLGTTITTNPLPNRQPNSNVPPNGQLNNKGPPSGQAAVNILPNGQLNNNYVPQTLNSNFNSNVNGIPMLVHHRAPHLSSTAMACDSSFSNFNVNNNKSNDTIQLLNGATGRSFPNGYGHGNQPTSGRYR